MLAWYKANDASCAATYVVHGMRKADDQETIALVSADGLQAELQAYTSSTHQIYAVQAHKTYDAPLLAAVNREMTHDAALVERYANGASELGAIGNAHTKRDGATPLAAPRPRAAPSAAPRAAPSAAPSKEQDTKPAPSGETRRVRKKRKVVRKVKTKNEKGYTITQDVEEYESYSEDEPVDAPKAEATPEAKPEAKPKAPPKRPAPKGKQQPSLTSFFTKQAR